MKIKQNILKLIMVCSFLGTVSCTDDFNDINQDPNSFNEAPIESAFTGVVKTSYDILGDMNGNMYLHYASYNGGVGGQMPKFGMTASAVGEKWREVFVKVLKNTQRIIDDHDEDPTYANRMHMIKIWKAYMYSIAVSTWGPIPMSDAFGLNTSVMYDSEEQIYTEILKYLDEAVTGLDDGGDVLAVDVIFDQDVNMWRKFANTLRLKIGLRLSHGFPGLSQAAVSASMAREGDLIGSNNENVSIVGGITEENWNWHYNKYVFGSPNEDTFPYVNHSYLLHLKTYSDPRMDILIEDARQPLEVLDMVYATGSTTEMILVSYHIPKTGKTLGNNALDAWDLNGNDNPVNGSDGSNFSLPSQELFFQNNNPYHIITNAETNFMKAEAAVKGWGGSKSAEAYYNDGINASFSQYGLSGDVAAYTAQDGIKWGTSFAGDRDIWGITTSGITADPMDQIIRQRWIAMFWQGHDAWTMLKRTRGITLPPHTNADNTASLNADWAEIPERMVYDTSEATINPDGYATGLDHLGGLDHITTPLKMNKPGANIDWNAAPAVYNYEFSSHWYGDSEDDLIAQGIPYTIL